MIASEFEEVPPVWIEPAKEVEDKEDTVSFKLSRKDNKLLETRAKSEKKSKSTLIREFLFKELYKEEGVVEIKLPKPNYNRLMNFIQKEDLSLDDFIGRAVHDFLLKMNKERKELHELD